MAITGPISQRIDMLRFLMIFGVVVVHTQIFAPTNAMPYGWYPDILAFFQDAVFRCTVPLLSLVSGYCLYMSGLDTRIRDLIVRKARTLLVPFLVFNLGLLLADFLAYQVAGRSLVLDPPAMDMQAWLSAAFAIYSSPINFPLYFLRDLMVLVVLAPLFGWILRRAALPGLIGIAALFLTDMDGYLILRGDMPVEFYLGGMLALRKVDLARADKYAYPALGVFLAACVGVTWFDWPFLLPLRIVSPFMIWPIGAALVATAAGQWLIRQSRYSFFIFIAHAPVLMVLWTANKYAGRPLPEHAFPVIAPFVAVALLIAIYRVAASVAPVSFAMVTGARASAKVRRERRVASAAPGMWPAENERRVAVL